MNDEATETQEADAVTEARRDEAYEQARREIEDKIAAQLKRLDHAQERFDTLDKERKDAKSALDTEHNVLVKHARDLRDLLTGEYQPSLPLTDGEPEGEEDKGEPCAECEGKGRIDSKTCDMCGGTGRIEIPEEQGGGDGDQPEE